jgi:hypothetical protein
VHLAARIQPVERAGAAALVERHGAGPEASGRVALAVVHALVRPIGFDLRNRGHRPARQVQPREPVVHRQHEIARLRRGDGADHAIDVIGANRVRRGIEAMDAAAEDVDEVEARAGRIPDRTLAELGCGVEHELDPTGHHTRTASGDAIAPGL